MRRSSKSELQQLRELCWLLLPMETCYFCREPLIQKPLGLTFGHRRHGPIKTKLSVHHVDHNREHNELTNLRIAHKKCHVKYHSEVNSGARSKPLSADSGRLS